MYTKRPEGYGTLEGTFLSNVPHINRRIHAAATEWQKRQLGAAAADSELRVNTVLTTPTAIKRTATELVTPTNGGAELPRPRIFIPPPTNNGPEIFIPPPVEYQGPPLTTPDEVIMTGTEGGKVAVPGSTEPPAGPVEAGAAFDLQKWLLPIGLGLSLIFIAQDMSRPKRKRTAYSKTRRRRTARPRRRSTRRRRY